MMKEFPHRDMGYYINQRFVIELIQYKKKKKEKTDRPLFYNNMGGT